MADLREGKITCEGVSAPYIEAGPEGEKQAVVYVHGNPGSSGDWRDLVARTGEFARAIAIDVQGFGQSDKPHPHDFDYTAAGLGIHLAHQLDQLGVERAHFVGHDFGGPFAVFATLFRPERTASLSFVNSGVLRGYRWHFWARVWRTPVLGELSMMAMNRTGMRRTLGDLPADFIDEMWHNFDRRTRRVVLRLYRTTNTEDQAIAVPLLRAANFPSVVIWGDDDPFIAPKFAERNLEAFPGATVHHVRGGHWPFIDNADAVAELLMPFLRERLAAG
ncbi:MAG: alpha/beta hydrolase [Actinobacteria bacterium]|nr:alpha/beta hydrolase [Actinomycetota bacterium]